MDWYLQIPPVTRTYLTLICLTTLATYTDITRPYLLFYSPALVLKGEYWRLLTTFLYLGSLSMDWLLHIYFLYRYCENLEQTCRTADFVWMLVLFCVMILVGGIYIDTPFLSNCLVFSITYLWSRRNPFVNMGLFGVLNFQAQYLCWVLVGFSLLVGQSLPYHDLVGLFVGHIYYYFQDVYPRLQASNGRKPLDTPRWLIDLLG